MAVIDKSLGRRRDWPLVFGASYAAVAAGSASDPAQDILVYSHPEMRHRLLPTGLPSKIVGSLPNNRMIVGETLLSSGGSANTVGNATNYADLRLNLYRLGVLQGCLAYYSLSVNTAIGTAIAAAGAGQTVTPTAMTNIVAGMALGVGSGSTFEVVYPYNLTSTTFTADFAQAHASTDAVTSILVPFQPIAMTPAIAASTTSSTAVSSAGSHAVTPASMYGIHVGDYLAISGGTGTAETVQVTAVTATTFTATWANTHSGTYNIATTPQTTGNNTIVANEPFVILGGDVLALGRVSNNATGIATPLLQVAVELLPAGIAL